MTEVEKVKESVKHFIGFIDRSKNTYRNNKEQIKEIEGFIKDIVHIKEAKEGKLNAVQITDLEVEERKAIIQRRMYRDENRYFRLISLFLEKYSDLKSDLSRLLYQFHELDEELASREYFAKSKEGQELINKYSNDDDWLVRTAVNEGKLSELKNKLEMKNCS